MNKIPVAALSEGHIVTLEGDRFVDPRSDVDELATPVAVVGYHPGIPTAHDEHRAFKLIGDWSDVAAKDVPEQARTLLVVTPAPSSKLLAAYFPDDQHEVVVDLDNQDGFE